MTEERCPCEDMTVEELVAAARQFAPSNSRGAGRIPAALGRYWTRGEGAAKIGWGTDGAYERCVALVGAKVKKLGIDIHGLCANLEKRATGHWPAEKVIDS
jgi:hypothetical protein